MARAAEMSIELMLALAWGERRVWPQSIPSAQRSDENANMPRTFGTPSGLGALVPTRGAWVLGGVSVWDMIVFELIIFGVWWLVLLCKVAK